MNKIILSVLFVLIMSCSAFSAQLDISYNPSYKDTVTNVGFDTIIREVTASGNNIDSTQIVDGTLQNSNFSLNSINPWNLSVPFTFMPIGSVVQYCGDTVPDGWIECDGRSLYDTQYPSLHNIIGNIYGYDTTTFKIPDMRGRTAVGNDTRIYDIGDTGGEETHKLNIAEMPSHVHNQYSHINTQSLNILMYSNAVASDRGGDQPHNNMMPYSVVKYIIFAGSN